MRAQGTARGTHSVAGRRVEALRSPDAVKTRDAVCRFPKRPEAPHPAHFSPEPVSFRAARRMHAPWNAAEWRFCGIRPECESRAQGTTRETAPRPAHNHRTRSQFTLGPAARREARGQARRCEVRRPVAIPRPLARSSAPRHPGEGHPRPHAHVRPCAHSTPRSRTPPPTRGARAAAPSLDRAP